MQRLKHEEIKQRYQSKGPWTLARWLVRRLTEIEMVLLDKYGWELPDDDAGLADLRIVLFHMAKCAKHNERTMTAWITEHAPWLTPAWAEEHAARLRYVPSAGNLIRYAIASKAKKPPTRKRLAKMLGLTDAVRTRLSKGLTGAITTIGVIDERQSRARRKQRKSDWDRAYQQTKRRDLGAKPHADSASRTKPWEAEGISRPTWYRRRETNSSYSNVAKLHAARRSSLTTERAARPSWRQGSVSDLLQAAVRTAMAVQAARPQPSRMVRVFGAEYRDLYRDLCLRQPREILATLEESPRGWKPTAGTVRAG